MSAMHVHGDYPPAVGPSTEEAWPAVDLRRDGHYQSRGAPPDAETGVSPAILEAAGVTFVYPNGTVALNNLSLTIPRGRRVALLGINGCGKTTLFLHFNGILQPTNGTIRLGGEPVCYDRKSLNELRRRVGLVFQDPDSQLFAASVRQDISFGPLNLGWSEDRVREKVEQAIRDTGISDLADRPTHLLSYGQKKRVAIAGVLVMEPEVIIADEPTAGLDPAMTARLLHLLDRLHGDGRTIVLATHDVELALAWADHVILLYRGQLVAAGRPEEVFADAECLRQARLLPPIVMDAYLQLRTHGLLPHDAPVPRTATQLVALIASGVPGK